MSIIDIEERASRSVGEVQFPRLSLPRKMCLHQICEDDCVEGSNPKYFLEIRYSTVKDG
jgi:hypothetical protein